MASYPDYGKTPPEYFVVITNLLASYPQAVVDRIANPRSGIASRTKFLPTVADVTEMAEEIFERMRIMARPSPVLSRSIPARKPFRPFPKLWDAFADDPEMLRILDGKASRVGISFETLDGAARMLATKGTDAARDFLLSGRLARSHV